MTEHGILFSGEMVRALLNTEIGSWPPRPIDPEKPCKGVTRRLSKRWLKAKRGDRLWVRETHAIMGVDWPRSVRVARAERMPAGRTLADTDGGLDLINLPDEDLDMMPWLEEHIDTERWRPSIFMPRCLSRLLLEAMEDAREERLHDITEGEAILEGIERRPGNYLFRDYSLGDQFADWTVSAIKSYASLWGSLHPKPGARWEDNPSLVRLAFRRLA